VRARVTGILEKRLFTEGSWVKAGQPLFLIDPKPLQAQAAAAQAEVARVQAQVTQADREVARLKPLAEKRAVGQKEADDAASNGDLATCCTESREAKAAEVNLSLGIHTRRLADHGAFEPREQSRRGASSPRTTRC
jgi:membrane fusion protein (multidrug efflux system)